MQLGIMIKGGGGEDKKENIGLAEEDIVLFVCFWNKWYIYKYQTHQGFPKETNT